MDEVESDSPWALQLAARVEKLTPPTTAAVCAAAALATIELLDDERSAADGIWHKPVSTWNGTYIRKIMRRARASAWERAQTVSGITVERDGAEVRAFVPSPMDQAPREITKLQIQSTPLDETAEINELPAMTAATLAIALTPHFEMSWGKQAAQCAHAGQRAWMAAPADVIEVWVAHGKPLTILHPSASLWDALDEVATTRIHDGGFTEIPAGTNSSIAWFCPIG